MSLTPVSVGPTKGRTRLVDMSGCEHRQVWFLWNPFSNLQEAVLPNQAVQSHILSASKQNIGLPNELFMPEVHAAASGSKHAAYPQSIPKIAACPLKSE